MRVSAGQGDWTRLSSSLLLFLPWALCFLWSCSTASTFAPVAFTLSCMEFVPLLGLLSWVKMAIRSVGQGVPDADQIRVTYIYLFISLLYLSFFTLLVECPKRNETLFGVWFLFYARTRSLLINSFLKSLPFSNAFLKRSFEDISSLSGLQLLIFNSNLFYPNS